MRSTNGCNGSCCQHNGDALYIERTVEQPSAAHVRLLEYVLDDRCGTAMIPRSATFSPATLTFDACIDPSLLRQAAGDRRRNGVPLLPCGRAGETRSPSNARREAGGPPPPVACL